MEDGGYGSAGNGEVNAAWRKEREAQQICGY
jgi:hypothetical protein